VEILLHEKGSFDFYSIQYGYNVVKRGLSVSRK